ncbi:cytochrome P450 [Pseudanabaena sp. BC1403]|uniref:cytochrome P450 n=1 Tax=Pseudanabaena sp. BC1403 TaxID=2043171 RepID=UPI000CD94E34|nr:cytochrome P450 [Pseudanabaena sp. BC1403]
MTTNSVKFDPFSPDFHANPYPIYDWLRQHDPIHWSFMQAWVITRHHDVDALLKAPQLHVDDLPMRLRQKSQYLKQGNFEALAQTIENWLFFLEPPHHTKLKSLVAKAFSPQMIETMRPAIAELVDRLLTQAEQKASQNNGEIDVMTDFAAPLPAMTVTQILGVPLEDHDKLMRWSYDLFFVFDQPMSLSGYQKQNEIAIEAREYLINLMETKPSGLIGQLMAARDRGTQLSEDEILGFCIMLLIVGQETTKSLIGNSVLALLQHPQALAELQQNLDLVPAAIEELLRYDSPVQVIARLATEDFEYGGKTIHAGDKVILCLGAANRDRKTFPEPDQINFHRHNYNLPFGGGLHYCLGAALARVQGQIAIKSLIQRYPHLALTDFSNSDLQWRESITLRGLKTLSVRLSAS